MIENNELLDRLWHLHEALQYDTQEEQLLTDIDRININQERASIWQFIDNNSLELKKVLPILEHKINQIHKMITQTNWQPKKNEDEFKRNQSK